MAIDRATIHLYSFQKNMLLFRSGFIHVHHCVFPPSINQIIIHIGYLHTGKIIILKPLNRCIRNIELQ
jgi:hypothetical protein